MFKSKLPLILLLLSAGYLNAQKTAGVKHQKWEFGLQVGAMQGQTDINNFGLKENNPGGGLLLRYHLDNHIALRANLLYGEITGDDANFNTPNRKERNFSFYAPVAEGSVVMELDFLGARRWKEDGTFRRTFSPYIFGGAGYTITKPNTNYNETNNISLRADIIQDKSNTKEGQFIMPLGLGARMDINENWVIGIETGLRVTFDDYLDGISVSGNPRKRDTYSMTAVTLTYRFPFASDKDHDGIPDSEDACPDAKGTEATKGCPDSDGDGIADNLDNCPDAKGAKGTAGCPDTDGDSIADKSDACPNDKGTVASGGCPDKDKDGIIDEKDTCPDVFGLPKFKGCPDTDGDGIVDSEDTCPDKAGTAANKGCPVNDRDRDGVADADDKCPDVAGPASYSGCPDTDKDGVADHLDKCPDVAGTAANSGCPVLTETDKKVLADAIYGVQFESGKSVIKTTSYAILDQVTDVLKRYPAYNLTISGHTDSAGSDASNQKLSEARAKACFEYLSSKGIETARMSHTGYGESRPVAENTTVDGKAKNRRVEFELKLK
jgi:outer membrane protein OmpA-like peptidoglycan-associated protein/opacity protein-like surface antigen